MVKAFQSSNAISKVYGLTGLGLMISFVIAYMVGTTPEILHSIFSSGWQWPVILAPLGIIMLMSFMANELSGKTLLVLFGVFSVFEGLGLSLIFVKYPGAVISQTLLTTSLLFGAMSAWGFYTNKDLSNIGTILFMALVGLIIAMIINMFLHSGMMAFVINVIGVLVFLALTAYDTQAIKDQLAYSGDNTKNIVMGSVSLYLDFLNLFQFLLNLNSSIDD